MGDPHRFIVLTVLLAMVGFVGSGGMALATPATTGMFSFAFLVDNPCTPGFDAISGSADLRFVSHFHPGELGSFHTNIKGSGTSAAGLKYQVSANSSFVSHDFLPAHFMSKTKFTSQGSTDNFEVDFAIFVNEQGVVTRIDLGGTECKG